MCGIAGIFNPQGLDDSVLHVHRMIQAIRHRGPDAEGFHVEKQAQLGSCRLSIIDVDAGPQPIWSEDGRTCIVFNGEIYNYRELREQLAEHGRLFRTHTDTEVVLQAYLKWGNSCVERFKGMFAFCIWDSRRQSLFLARDHFGIKPLYYSRLPDGTFLFGSEIKAILTHSAIQREVNPQAIDNLFTFGFNTAPHTFFQGIEQLLPGHILKVDRHGIKMAPYWDIPAELPYLHGDDCELIERFRGKLQEAVRQGVVSDVPVGVYLSGGIDSSAIAALYSKSTDQPVKTITITFDGADYDERDFSRSVASSLAAEHHEFKCSIGAEEIGPMVRALENPIVSLLHLPLYLLSGKAKELGLKVVLSGDGSDEILGGYDYFKQLKCMEFIKKGGPWRKSVLKRLYPTLQDSQLAPMHEHLARAAERFPVNHPAIPYRYREFQFKEQLYSRRFAQRLSHFAQEPVQLANVGRFSHRPAFDQAIYLETKLRLLNLTLPLADKMGMTHSVEVRPLFLDHELVELLFQIPPHLKMQGLNEKFLLKESMKGIVPETIRARRKQPFNPPAPWFLKTMDELVMEYLSPGKVREADYFDPQFVQELLIQHRKGGSLDLSGLIVVVFFIQMWHEVMINGKDMI
ncbi:asparagine synthase (glutamine-hydrolyzing) [Desulforhabdus amnigena]|uniref:asparagine synthase (glutamine-hydrolyzing) n=1 Tax=Desulforhabdus amnigena TaxID=40218 RepID=A0A9W6FRH0_9BACT|nr:asparagine synthase (glutamine-hydrolyzing) [Desulforhabdus amnigena]GLI33527.1 asparagine synthetase B [Desulforhabdus amnigena]